MSDQLQQYIPVGLLVLVAVGFAVTNLMLPTLLGKKRVHAPVKDEPYECGLPPLTEGQPRFSVKFYQVAMLFILFDIEVVFMIGWGAVFRELIRPVEAGGIGWAMLGGGALFLAILEVGHVYAWRKGALDWAPRRAAVRDRVAAIRNGTAVPVEASVVGGGRA
ncbi:MAG: NADH-quinone oxidoreductase subunit A [Verrucomicrobiae bacterium]|nr:NADH-quinone oxidoreductase subunit A [Verrucomicrobiae bacterium]MDW8344057.1 NADH-quinone oxidoreductase subunit A [Verrucomicrobiae bacterium]